MEMAAISALADEVVAKIEAPHRKQKTYMKRNPRASGIGPCAREQALSITEWARRPVPDTWLSQRFQRGNEVEALVRRNLIDAGYELVENQTPFEIDERIGPAGDRSSDGEDTLICTGHTDGKIAWEGEKPVTEIKSMNVNIWNRVNEFADFERMGSFWKRYTNQILLYMYANDETAGLFLLDDCMGHIKAIPVLLDDHLDKCEAALRTCRIASYAVASDTLPDFHPDTLECRKCWAREIGACKPAMEGEVITILDDAQTEEWLFSLEADKEAAKRFGTADRKFKDQMKGRGPGVYLCGDYSVTVTQKPSKSYDVPKEIKDQFASDSFRTYTVWERLVTDGS